MVKQFSLACVLATTLLLFSCKSDHDTEFWCTSSNPSSGYCTNSTMECADDKPCFFICSATSSCTNKTLICPSNHDCYVHCTGSSSCTNMVIYGPSDLSQRSEGCYNKLNITAHSSAISNVEIYAKKTYNVYLFAVGTYSFSQTTLYQGSGKNLYMTDAGSGNAFNDMTIDGPSGGYITGSFANSNSINNTYIDCNKALNVSFSCELYYACNYLYIDASNVVNALTFDLFAYGLSNSTIECPDSGNGGPYSCIFNGNELSDATYDVTIYAIEGFNDVHLYCLSNPGCFRYTWIYCGYPNYKTSYPCGAVPDPTLTSDDAIELNWICYDSSYTYDNVSDYLLGNSSEDSTDLCSDYCKCDDSVIETFIKFLYDDDNMAVFSGIFFTSIFLIGIGIWGVKKSQSIMQLHLKQLRPVTCNCRFCCCIK